MKVKSGKVEPANVPMIGYGSRKVWQTLCGCRTDLRRGAARRVLTRCQWLSSTLACPNAVNAAPGAGHHVLRSLNGDALAKNGAEDFHFRIA